MTDEEIQQELLRPNGIIEYSSPDDLRRITRMMQDAHEKTDAIIMGSEPIFVIHQNGGQKIEIFSNGFVVGASGMVMNYIHRAIEHARSEGYKQGKRDAAAS